MAVVGAGVNDTGVCPYPAATGPCIQPEINKPPLFRGPTPDGPIGAWRRTARNVRGKTQNARLVRRDDRRLRFAFCALLSRRC